MLRQKLSPLKSLQANFSSLVNSSGFLVEGVTRQSTRLLKASLFLVGLLVIITNLFTPAKAAWAGVNYNTTLFNIPATFTECEPLVVTIGDSDNATTCGTLRYAVEYLAANPTTPTKTISFNLATPVTLTLSSTLTIPTGVTIQGACGVAPQTQPLIRLDGTLAEVSNTTSGVTPTGGIILTGNNALYGLEIGGFAGSQIYSVNPSPAANHLNCVRVRGGGGQLLSVSLASQVATVNTAYPELRATLATWQGEPISGATVTFTLTSGQNNASALFSGGSQIVTATTDATGVAEAPTLTANTTAGKFNLSVTSFYAGISRSSILELTNLAAAPATIVVTSGSNQTAKVGTAFGARLVASVHDQYGNPVINTQVIFSIPSSSSGASGNFYSAGSGTKTATVATDLAGIATSPLLYAATLPGNFTAEARPAASSGVAPAVYNLTVQPGDPASLTIVSGNLQTAIVGASFGNLLKVRVRDQFGNNLSGVSVTFQAPSGSTASGSFAGNGTFVSVSTDSSGVATAPTFTANTLPGSYAVTAKVAATTLQASFSLANLAGPPTQLSIPNGTPISQQTTVGTAFAQPFKASVKDQYGNLLNGVTVNFTVQAAGNGATGAFSGGAGSVSVATVNGIATTPAFVANNLPGSYTVVASVSGVGTTLTFNLTNKAGAPASITVTNGNNQQSNVGKQFALPLQVRIMDALGNALSGITVNFVAPNGGASGTFAGTGTNSTSVSTDANGYATTSSFTANLVAGSYVVQASVAGLGSTASFNLTNFNGPTTIRAWVSNPNPVQNTVQTVSAELIVNGLPAQGAILNTTWHYKTTTPVCNGGIAGSDGVASCSRNIGGASHGYQVIIDVVMIYNGVTYTTSTSFTTV